MSVVRSLLWKQRWIAVLLFAVSVALTAALAYAESNTEEGDGVELRLAALENPDGSVSVGVQYRVDGDWSRTLRPARGKMPADSAIESWRASSPLRVPIRQTKVHIEPSNPRWTDIDNFGQFVAVINGQRHTARCGRIEIQIDGLDISLITGNQSCDGSAVLGAAALANEGSRGVLEIRILARRLSDDRTELSLQLRTDGEWQATQEVGTLPAVLSTDSWMVTEPIALPVARPHVTADLRDAAAISTVGSEMRAHIDGVIRDTNCGRLSMSISFDSLLVDTVDESCVRSEALATVCAVRVVGSGCDIQRNQTYSWQRRHDVPIRDVSVTIDEAQDIVDAIFADHFPRSTSPRVVRSSNGASFYTSSDRTIGLADWGFRLDVVIHELAHALVDQAGAYRTGHSGAFTVTLLEMWERYLPLLDTDAARGDAELTALEVDEESPIEPVSGDGFNVVRKLLCDYPAKSKALCDAFDGVMPLSGGDAGGRYVGSGGRGGVLLWWAFTDEQTGGFRSYVTEESRESSNGNSIARLLLQCNHKDELEVQIRWRGDRSIPPELSHRFGRQSWQTRLWFTTSGTSGDNSWVVHFSPDAQALLRDMLWHANSNLPFAVRYEHNGQLYLATFSLKGVFSTPVQGNLVRCGVERSARDPDELVIDYGNFGDDFFWGVDEDEDPARTYVVRDTKIDRSDREARLSVQCQDGQLEFYLYWEIDRDLDWTVRWRVNDGPVQVGEWNLGWGTWDVTDYKWTALEDADNLLAALYWAAQSGGSFTAQVHERGNANRRYTATWVLDGLFETLIQPNLAGCAR